MKTAELSGATLDWAVAKCEGFKAEYWDDDRLCFTDDWGADFEPSCDWAQGGKIIEREGISLIPPHDDISAWEAYHPTQVHNEYYGTTPLEAAMRCYVASKLGDEVEVPDELLSCAHE